MPIAERLSIEEYVQETLSLHSLLPPYRKSKASGFRLTSKRYKIGDKLPIISPRQSLLEGQYPPTNLTLDNPWTIFQLESKEDGVWMTTMPQEIGQMIEPLHSAKGNILVGGLGLGVFPSLLSKRHKAQGLPSNVDSITVVERDPNIIQLVSPFLDPSIHIIQDDLYEFTKQVKPQEYDFAFLDIWQSTGEWTWQTHIVPLHRLLRNKIKTVMNWQEGEMQTQVQMGAARFACLHPSELSDRAMTAHRWVFRKALEQACPGIKGLKAGEAAHRQLEELLSQQDKMNKNPHFNNLLSLFLHPELPAWETTFGKWWDESLPWYKGK